MICFNYITMPKLKFTRSLHKETLSNVNGKVKELKSTLKN